MEKQAVDRVHRLNAPNKDVFCYRLRAQDSVDEIVAAKQTEKLAWVRHTIGMLEQHHLDDAGAFEPMVGPPA